MALISYEKILEILLFCITLKTIAAEYIFIFYSTHDSGFVHSLRQSLEEAGISVWVDSRNMRGGSKLVQEIAEAIYHASHTIVVLSPHTVNSPWVREEIALALEVEKEKNSGYRVIPLLLPGIEPAALDLWFHEQPLALPIRDIHRNNQTTGFLQCPVTVLSA